MGRISVKPKRRTELEQDLTAALAKALRLGAKRLREALGDDLNAQNLSNEIWQAIEKEVAAALLPTLEAVYIEGAQEIADVALIGLDEDALLLDAVRWAEAHALMIARQMNDTNRRTIAASLYQKANPLGERLRRLFDLRRAESVAVTEITRALSLGKQFAARVLNRKLIVKTEGDAKVCSICAPKDGKEASEVGHPPFHRRCRCDEELADED